MSTQLFKPSKGKLETGNGKCTASLDQKETLIPYGYTCVEVLSGKIEINGFIIDESTGGIHVLFGVAHSKNACLYINAIENSKIHLTPLRLGSKYILEDDKERTDPLFKIRGCKFITHNSKDKRDYSALKISKSWKKTSDYFRESPSRINSQCIMVCGRMQSGKSTFCRFLINSLLNKYSRIAFMDCDVSQSEFTPEGMVSITIIDSPIFGAPHTHQHYMKLRGEPITGFKHWKSYYYGSNNLYDDPSFYLQCIQQLYSQWTASGLHHEIPLIVNCNGWISGIGHHVLQSIIVTLSPSDLIEVQWKDHPLFGGSEMQYLAEAKDMFIQQNTSHFWNDPKYQFDPTKDSQSEESENVDNSLIASWVQSMSSEKRKTLKTAQKKWMEFLGDLKHCNLPTINVDDGEIEGKWYRNIEFSKGSRSERRKSYRDLEVFKCFVNAHCHYIKSVAPQISKRRKDEEKVSDMRHQRRTERRQHQLLTMVSYFTQNAFEDEPAVYLRERDCYKIPFDDVAILFLNEMMESENVNDGLILRALNGVIVGLGVMENTGKMEADDEDRKIGNEPPQKRRKLNGQRMDGVVRLIDQDECSEQPSCVGMGIIRSINWEKRLFYLITPVPPKQLNDVNVFIRGNITLPLQLLFDDSAMVAPPYCNTVSMKDRIIRSMC